MLIVKYKKSTFNKDALLVEMRGIPLSNKPFGSKCTSLVNLMFKKRIEINKNSF
jgi:hypothetical protein